MGLELLDHMDEYIAELKLKEPVVEEVVDEVVEETVVDEVAIAAAYGPRVLTIPIPVTS